MSIFIGCNCFPLDEICVSYSGIYSNNIYPNTTKEEYSFFHLEKQDPRTNRPSKENSSNLPKEEPCDPSSECIEHKEEDIKMRYEYKSNLCRINVLLHQYE